MQSPAEHLADPGCSVLLWRSWTLGELESRWTLEPGEHERKWYLVDQTRRVVLRLCGESVSPERLAKLQLGVLH
jgi:hypothetical protein